MALISPCPPQPKWLVDLSSAPPARPKASLPDPPGYTPSAAATTGTLARSKGASNAPARTPPSQADTDSLKLKKAWEVALAPAKQLPMNAIGMYMTGNSLQIFSIMMVFMLFKAPVTALMNVNATFQRFESKSKSQEMILVKLAFIACNLLALGLGMWKVNAMGLLPLVPHGSNVQSDDKIGLVGLGNGARTA